MLYPSGILTNLKTGRFHPIVFRLAPMPGNADANASAQRYKSLGHHTEGFDTLADAERHLKEHEAAFDTGRRYDWDGEDMPAMVEWFSTKDVVAA